MSSLTPQLAQAAERAAELHQAAVTHATQAVKSAIMCGAVLKQVHLQMFHSETPKKGDENYGQWIPFLESAGISRTTALRYMAVAEAFDAKAQHLLEGKSLSDLYRELGLIKPAAGGGNRLGGEELNRRKAEDQMVFHFDLFEIAIKEVNRYTARTGHANPFESLDSATLGHTREQLLKALELVDAALASA